MMAVRMTVLIALLVVGFGALLFGGAGRLDLPWLWAYLVGWALYAGVSSGLSVWLNPTLMAERMKPPSDRDRLTRRLAVGPCLAHLVVAGLDARYGWSSMPVTLRLLGFASMTLAWSLIAWTFATNRFASSAVRIQTERNHEVITTGPYAIVRHHMYLGVFLTVLGSPLALGSWWALLVVSPVALIFVRRTRLEDRMLHDELPGYAEYARRTRYRIVPGIF